MSPPRMNEKKCYPLVYIRFWPPLPCNETVLPSHNSPATIRKANLESLSASIPCSVLHAHQLFSCDKGNILVNIRQFPLAPLASVIFYRNKKGCKVA